MKHHRESFMLLEELGTRIPPYLPTFDFPEEFINDSHRFFATVPTPEGVLIEVKTRPIGGTVIQGWLRREDSLKLYELAYFVTGDILELGSYHGLSTSILSQANYDSPNKKSIYTVDIDPANIATTDRNLSEKELSNGVRAISADAVSAIGEFAASGMKFEFVFVDHSHAYDAVYAVCRELDRVLLNGAYCLFHDFNDERNRDTCNDDYGVYQAVHDGLDPAKFEFCGIYGCAALYRFRCNT